MFGIGSTELVIIIIVALIVIGPQKLPEMMRSVGKGLAEFKRVGQDVKDTLDKEVKQAEEDIKQQEEQVKKAARLKAESKAEAVLDDETEKGGGEKAQAAAEADSSGETVAENGQNGGEAASDEPAPATKSGESA